MARGTKYVKAAEEISAEACNEELRELVYNHIDLIIHSVKCRQDNRYQQYQSQSQNMIKSPNHFFYSNCSISMYMTPNCLT